jgi:hypothetical protein
MLTRTCNIMAITRMPEIMEKRGNSDRVKSSIEMYTPFLTDKIGDDTISLTMKIPAGVRFNIYEQTKYFEKWIEEIENYLHDFPSYGIPDNYTMDVINGTLSETGDCIGSSAYVNLIPKKVEYTELNNLLININVIFEGNFRTAFDLENFYIQERWKKHMESKEIQNKEEPKMETITRRVTLQGLDKNAKIFVHQKVTEESIILTISEHREGDIHIPSGKDIGQLAMIMTDDKTLSLELHSAVILTKIKESMKTLNTIRYRIRDVISTNLEENKKLFSFDELKQTEDDITDCIDMLKNLYAETVYKTSVKEV